MQLTSTTGNQVDDDDNDNDDHMMMTMMMKTIMMMMMTIMTRVMKMMMILTGDPDRACRVACQDSKISYRFIDKLLIILMLVTFMVLLVPVFWQVSTSLHWVSHLFSPLSLSP